MDFSLEMDIYALHIRSWRRGFDYYNNRWIPINITKIKKYGAKKRYYYFGSYKKAGHNLNTRLVLSLNLGVINMQNALHLIKNILI